MNNDPYRRLHFDKLRKQFPMFTDAQILSKLKEFAQYYKKGENTGWWRLKTHLPLLDEDGIRKLVTPESVSIFVILDLSSRKYSSFATKIKRCGIRRRRS